jgi:1-acyl-sn-glycerol-3-phosphate acyltransferase
VCGLLSLLVSLVDKKGRMQHRIARFWARAAYGLRRLLAHRRGAENLRKHPVAVYASNHTSYMDTPVVFAALPFQFRILAKKELWPIPFIGWYLDRSGQIPIDTANPRATLSSLGLG